MHLPRFASAAAIVLALLPAAAPAQTMRFQTNVGSFDMVLNPTNDPNLQPLVDNMVAYIGLGRYSYTAINRAAEDFVLQMGSFLGFPPTPENFLNLIQEVERLEPVVVDANQDGQVDFNSLSNIRGTVSLALSAGNPNSGTSSFFINLGDNSGLDSQGFVPFAQITDMTTIDRIMELEQTNLTGNPNDLTFRDVPLRENGRLVILESVRVLSAAPNFSFVGPIDNALRQQAAASPSPAVAAATSAATQAAASISSAVPEPSAASLAAAAAALAVRSFRRRSTCRIV